MIMPVFYARPHAAGKALDVARALAGHAEAGSTRKDRLAGLADDIRLLVAEDLRVTPDPLGLLLNIGLPSNVPLLSSNDLDRFVYPLVPRLTAATRRPFVSVWASKRHARTSSVGVFQALPARDPGGAEQFQVRTSASIVAPAFRQQIHNQLASGGLSPTGGIALQLSFVVGPRRAWPNLWKATIDSLGPLLGHAVDTRGADGRITDLGLHCAVDPDLGHDVVIAIRATSSRTSTES
ncbi:hypothetical protein GCM10010112_07300 [Actinoplanes lobatus]|uniref:Uncharacterized protein n=1 Tax=Actinoplanes lobatus TaxID=113568 RepID=A0A7W7MES5_9ACTN|nr:hypothetical protein [Actinoplanes lobatus]MBB4747150.1 hypothetical protein [Actinoplanes lobatus]GGN55948.1 hypothetical protein GCM10010112_07300 [Actinoplanes lobatus]GIE39282.1 hypothetical protein Alo02nite_21800 [Actinoplanes lobatus]